MSCRHPAAVGAARAARPDRHQVRLRRRPVRRLHGAHRRRAGAQLRAAGVPRRSHRRRSSPSRACRPTAAPGAEGLGALDVPQCGYCQSGMIMAAAALLKAKPRPTDADIDEAMTNICRCGTYNRVRAAIKVVANGGDTDRRPGDPPPTGAPPGLSTPGSLPAAALPGAAFPARLAAAGGGLMLGFHVPMGRCRRTAPGPRSTPGWWCSPTRRW
jgi:hypothetical protein